MAGSQCRVCGKALEGRGKNAKYCSQACFGTAYSVPPPGKALSDVFPELAAEADGWDPTVVSSRAKASRPWRCKNGHRWEMPVQHRSRNGRSRGCPFCAGIYPVPGENDLATTHPSVASEVSGWDPTTVLAGSNKKLEWRCSQGHVWQAIVMNRTVHGQGCPFCAGRYPIAGQNDLATVDPDLAAEAHGWDPVEVLPFSHEKKSWKCPFDHVYEAKVADRSNGNGCPFCAGRRVLVGFNDLLTVEPEIGLEASGWDATSVTARSNKKMHWKCKLGHEWDATITNRTKNGSGCPTCSGRDVERGVNDLLTTHPNLAAEALGWDPRDVKAGSDKRLSWKCLEGHEWRSTVATRSRGSGCPSCARFGFKPDRDAWMYLVFDETRDLLQLGITNNRDERLAKHRRGGFDQVLDIRGPLDGVLARDLERACIRALERRGAVFVRDLDLDRFDGWTESWACGSLDVHTLQSILKMVYDDDF